MKLCLMQLKRRVISRTVLTLEKLAAGLREMFVDNDRKNKARRGIKQKKNCRHINQDKKRLDLLQMFVEVNLSRTENNVDFLKFKGGKIITCVGVWERCFR